MGNCRPMEQGKKDIRMSTSSIDAGHLKAFIERLERLDAERRGLVGDFNAVLDEAASMGYDKKILRKIVALRRQDVHKRREEEEILDLYMSNLGMA